MCYSQGTILQYSVRLKMLSLTILHLLWIQENKKEIVSFWKIRIIHKQIEHRLNLSCSAVYECNLTTSFWQTPPWHIPLWHIPPRHRNTPPWHTHPWQGHTPPWHTHPWQGHIPPRHSPPWHIPPRHTPPWQGHIPPRHTPPWYRHSPP